MKRVLLISYHFAPQNVIGALRPTKLAKYWSRMGYEVTVLCGESLGGARDAELARDLAEIHQVRALHARSLLGWWKARGRAAEMPPALAQRARLPETALRPSGEVADSRAAESASAQGGASARAGQGAAGILHTGLDALYLWLSDRADAAFARACTRELLTMEQRFDLVFSCYGPLSVHTAARRAKRFRVADRWIADFRDEATVHFPWQRAWLKRYMRKLRRSADAITAVSEGFLQMMRLDGFGTVVPNGFDPEDAVGLSPARLGEETLSLVYCGQLYPGRSDLSPVFRAARALADAGVCDEARFRFHYAGRQGAAFLAQADRFGLASRVVDHGMLPRAESLALQRGADALLAATWNTPERRGVVTGKLMEYMMADRPVFCCASGSLPGSEARALVETTRIGVVAEESRAAQDEPLLRAYLLELYRARFAGEPTPYRPDPEAVAAYRYDQIAARFARMMEAV